MPVATAELPRLSDQQRRTVEQHRSIAVSCVAQVVHRLPGWTDTSELLGIAYLALVQAVSMYPRYVEKNGYSLAEQDRYIAAYCTKRCRGALLDWMRSNDENVSRAQRSRIREAALAQERGIQVEEDAKLRAARAASANRPVSLDALIVPASGGEDGAGVTAQLPDHQADVAGQATVNAIIRATIKAIREMDTKMAAIVLLHHVHEIEMRRIGEMLNLGDAQAGALHAEALLTIHAAQMKAVAEDD